MQPCCIHDYFSRLQYPSHIAHRCGYPETPGLLGRVGGGWRAEVSSQRRAEGIRLGFGRVEPADETGEGPASSLELEAVALQRTHCPPPQLQTELVGLDPPH